MKIIIASDSYKGSCSTTEVANSIEKGIRRVFEDSDVVKIPVADGGEGTVDALVLGTKGKYEEVEVIGPLGGVVNATYGIIHNEIAVIEMAAASGLTLLKKEELNPLITTTYGTGQLIKSAMDKGIRKIYVGLGGSCTNDGGVGMAQALGISFKDKMGNEVSFGGGELSKIQEIDFTNVHPLLKETEVVAMSDVKNPLCGPTGASYVFGPQKGADSDMVKVLDENLGHLGELINNFMKTDIMNIPGTGAAGGLGAGILAFCNASIEQGIEKILDITNIDSHLKDADLVITGEGRIDEQSKYGKVPVGVAKRAKKYNIPVIAIVGSVGEGAYEVYSYGIDVIIDIINKPMTLEYAMENVVELLENASENLMRSLKNSTSNNCNYKI
jgi:glycerate kinase